VIGAPRVVNGAP